jgi:hypothetical protein
MPKNRKRKAAEVKAKTQRLLRQRSREYQVTGSPSPWGLKARFTHIAEDVAATAVTETTVIPGSVSP